MPFNPDIEKFCQETCPPNEATPVECDVYRGVPDLPLGEQHFMAHPEIGKSCNPKKCSHWGLSVWVSEDDAFHAIDLFPEMEGWSVAKGSIGKDDGVLLGTPSKRQPEHHTFWKTFGSAISGKFQLIEPSAT